MRIGVMYDGFSPLPEAMDLVHRADGVGVDSVWIAEHILFRDAFGPAAVFLARTNRISVVPTAVSPYLRNPGLIGMSLATLAELAPDRVRAVLATGQPDDLNALGVQPSRPLRTMEEALSVVRRVLSGDPLDHEGEIFGMKERALTFPPSPSVPLYLAGVGPKMLRLAGGNADGALLSGGCSPAYIRWGAERMREGESRTGRAPRTAAVGSVIVAALSSSRTSAYDAVRRTLAFILRGAHHERNRELAGTKIDREALADAVSRADWDRAEDMITDDVIRKHAVAGDESEFRERLAEFSEAGLDDAVLLLKGSPDDHLRALDVIAGM